MLILGTFWLSIMLRTAEFDRSYDLPNAYRLRPAVRFCPGARPPVDWTAMFAFRNVAQYLDETLNICSGMETRDCMSGRYVGDDVLCLRMYLECEVSVRTAQ
jgi:hypothetical protein